MDSKLWAWVNANVPDPTHRKRIVYTLRRLREIVEPGDSVLDVGGPSDLSRAVHHFFPDVDHGTTGTTELRSPWSPWAGRLWDVVTFTEVLEHIHDLPSTSPWVRSSFQATGAAYVLDRIVETLRPGGRLLLTTPNAQSVKVLERILAGRGPRLFDRHVREYTPAEVAAQVRVAGLAVDEVSTHYVYGQDGDRFERAAEFLRDHFRPGETGDTVFVLASKPTEPR